MLAGTACAQERTATPGSTRPPELAIIDTDIGDDIDDAFALGIALNSPELKLLGVTSAWGDTALRSRMLDRLLCATGREDIPVLTGVSTLALHRQGAAPFSQAAWAKAGLARMHGDAVEFLLRQARAHPGQVTLIAIAPLTNIGAAIDRDPAGFRMFQRVVLMGGSVNRGYGPAGSKPSAEYNIAMDPEAARKLFHSGVPIFMMPLDSTQIEFGPDRMATFVRISTPLTDAIQVLTAEYKLGTGWPAPTMFDPVAVAYGIDPTTCPTTPQHIEIDDKGFTRATPGEPNAQVCLEEHPDAFYALAMPRLVNQRMVGTGVCLER
jgi:inosine-uridine nucleoside N-ribohydrolase